VSPPTVGRIRGRAAFEQFRRPEGRAERGPVRVSYVSTTSRRAPGGTPIVPPIPQVGYVIGRRCGNAVVRNRIRRRLRSAVQLVAVTLPPGNYLVGASPVAAEVPFDRLVSAVSGSMSAAAGKASPPGSRSAVEKAGE
jgi:ribonuclease P protein component